MNSIQRRILRILYAWSLEHFTEYMRKEEFLTRMGIRDPAVTGELLEDLERKGLVETVPQDGSWEAVRITPDGVKIIRISDII
ncbi:MAG: hypothetical protein J7L32_00940 [Thermoplasmata archaeon]|nr:MAG: hypothetical protein FE035_00365 [Thermoplasmata archaeon]MCD6467865.1 hypothetical protein [Thermoplasmata archaeon]RLF27174.1 MAG: hypothetical protein DRN01_03085 [Thermoplasmata archaeon]